MKRWYDYHKSDARQFDHLYARDGTSQSSLALASRAVGELDMDYFMRGEGGRYQLSDLEYMKYKKKKFLDYFGTFHDQIRLGTNRPDILEGDRLLFDMAKRGAKHITYDNYKEHKRRSDAADRGMFGPSISPNLFSWHKLRHNFEGNRAVYVPY